MRQKPTRTAIPETEQGYVLVAVIFMLAIFVIALSVAVPRVTKEIQRDRELETVQRGKQYIRGLKLYYKKFGTYPPTVDALLKTQDIHFLRKKYKDPTTGKDEWKPIQFGQAKTQTLGFFGQPIAGTGSAGGTLMAGIGPSGGNTPQGGIGGTGITDQPPSTLPPGGDFGSDNGPGTGTGTSSPGSGQTFGGAGLIGFSPGSQKKSLIVWKKKDHYNEWEFVYDPLADMTTTSNNTGAIGNPMGQNPVGQNPVGQNPVGQNPVGTAPVGTNPTPPGPQN